MNKKYLLLISDMNLPLLNQKRSLSAKNNDLFCTKLNNRFIKKCLIHTKINGAVMAGAVYLDVMIAFALGVKAGFIAITVAF